mgnify:CR=1 FL=1
MIDKKLNLTTEDYGKLYYFLYLTRIADEISIKKYNQGLLAENPHSCQGEEAVAVGSGYALRQDDYILPSLRARGYFYVKGISLKEMMAGMYGKETGPARGKNTSHHMGQMDQGVIVGSGVIGGALPVAVGVAVGIQMDNKDSVVMVSFGEGTTSRGDFHEAINLAAVWKLPVIFICENNRWAMGNPIHQEMAVDNVAIRAKAYGIPGVTVDGNDVLEVYKATVEAIERARRGEGPTLVECVTQRWLGHSCRDTETYRDKEAEKPWICPVKKFKDYLINNNIFTEEKITAIEEAASKELDEAIQFAEESPYPSPEIVATNVYAE